MRLEGVVIGHRLGSHARPAITDLVEDLGPTHGLDLKHNGSGIVVAALLTYYDTRRGCGEGAHAD